MLIIFIINGFTALLLMTIQYCSDLHLEFQENVDFLEENPLKPTGEVLLLAGDIVPFSQMKKHSAFFDFVSDNFKTIFWLPGNHEYYHFELAEKCGALNEKIRPNIFLVNNCAIQRFTPSDYNKLHIESKAFLQCALQATGPSKTVVVTHHVPTFQNYPKEYLGDILNEAFAVELADMIETSDVDYWIYGHHHQSTPEFRIGSTRLITNQLGYVSNDEHLAFRQDLVIEV